MSVLSIMLRLYDRYFYININKSRGEKMRDANPIIKGETVETVYEMYRKNLFLVNRNYQRKLVWKIEEKISFVETIEIGLPVPLFLFAKKTYMGNEIYEIIDGMQRLNAIISFIEGEFPLNGKYFNLETNASMKLRKDKGELKQRFPVLDSEVSAKIAGYQLPVSTTVFRDDKTVEEAFKRINSSGKHLSKQELRQAGANNNFALLVRSIAEEIRGDNSYYNYVPLDKMKNISLSNKDLGYGITMRNIYWAKNSIITTDNIRESRDEELIAHLLVAIISQRKLNYTSNTLDQAYGFIKYDSSDINVEECISKYGYDKIKMQFGVVYQELKKVTEAAGKTFRDILFTSKSSYYVNRVYHVVFLAFYDLILNDELKITNYKDISKRLDNEGTKIFRDEDISRNENREKLISKVKGIIRDGFEKRSAIDPMLNNWITRVEALLSQVSVEDIGYDFKLGFHTMHDSKFDVPDYDTALETLLSMANKGKDSVGYVVVGIADKQTDASRHEDYYKSRSIETGKFFVVGIDSEAIKSSGSVDKYRTKLEQYIESADIKPVIYRDYILKNIQFMPYYDKTIILLQIKGDNEPVMYKNQYFHRIGTSTTPVLPESMKSLFRAFM